MIAVDTNILVRYAVKDDRSQTETATRFCAGSQAQAWELQPEAPAS